MEKQTLDARIEEIMQVYKGDPYRRAKDLKKLLKQAEQAADLFAIGKTNMLLANCILGQGKRDKILSYAYKAVRVFENTKERGLLARSYNLLGVGYASLGHYQQAITMYNRAMKVMHGRDYPGIQRDVLRNNIGDACFQMGVYRKSLRIALDCYAACRKKTPGSFARIVVYGLNVWNNYFALGMLPEAVGILEEIRPELERLQKSAFVAGYYTRLACVQYALGDPARGVQNADLALSLAFANCDSYEFHPMMESIAYKQIETGDYDRAQSIAALLAQYAQTSVYILDRILAKRVQARLCFARGESEQALALYKELSVLHEQQIREQKAIQYESQKSVEDANREIVKLMNRVQESREKAERDPMTGLLNRSALVRVTTEFLQEAKKQGKNLGGIFFDIDYFKEYNDTYGHTAGDEAIKLLAGLCLEEETRAVRFFRYGGDEYFGVVLGQSDRELERLALRITEKLRATGFVHAGNPNGARLTISMGIVNVCMKNSEDMILDIIKYADAALYHAKDRGKNDVFAYCALPDSGRAFRRISGE